MALLILGLLLWFGAHFFKRMAPAQRAAMQERLGDRSRGVFAGLLLLALVLMVIGYRGADTTFFWGRSTVTTGINNLLMIFAVVLFGAGSSKSRLREKLRHPMLTGAVVWAVAHLLVNGDSVSILLFGGLAVWALTQMALINRDEPDYTPWEGGSVAGDMRLAAISAIVFAVIAGIHTWLGYFPFGG